MSMITEQCDRLRTLADIAQDIAENSTDTVKTLREAADTIEQLAAKVRTENGGGWIPIVEPTPDTDVLCCNQWGDMLIGYLFEDKESNTGYTAESEGVLSDGLCCMDAAPGAVQGGFRCFVRIVRTSRLNLNLK